MKQQLQEIISEVSNAKSHTAYSDIVLTTIKTPIGDMVTGATTSGICIFEYPIEKRLKTQLHNISRRLPTNRIKYEENTSSIADGSIMQHIEQLNTEITQYFSGNRKEFSVKLHLIGTTFQKQAWQILQKIPYGKTISYHQQALEMSKPKAVRAVANANGKNTIAIIIPCHRVIGKNGNIAGYGGEIWRKKYLLELEKNSFA